MSKFFYRYEDELDRFTGSYDPDSISFTGTLNIVKRRFIFHKKTPKGCWVIRDCDINYINEFTWRRWISDTSIKKYAYQSDQDAWTSFKRRKLNQIKILSKKLARAREALDIINDMEDNQ